VSWQAGFVKSRANAVCQIHRSSYLLLHAYMSAGRTTATAESEGPYRDRGNARMDVVDNGRSIGVHMLTALAETLNLAIMLGAFHPSFRCIYS